MGFAVKNRLLRSITPSAEGTQRILSLRLQISSGPVSLISAYAPILASSAEAIDKFYDDLSAAIRRIPDRITVHHPQFQRQSRCRSQLRAHLLGSVQHLKNKRDWPALLELCCHHGLCISNTFFNSKLQQQVSWRHTRSKQWHQLDLILTRRVHLSSIKITRSYQSADCDTDHPFVCSKVKLRVKSLHRTRKD